MKSQILFVQGGGSGAYDEDARLASSLQRALGDDYQVCYPRMPNEADPAYDDYRAQIAAALASLAGPVFLVGHSLGGFFLMRLLAESPPAASIAGIFLIATPYVGPGGWQDAQYALPEDLAARFRKAFPSTSTRALTTTRRRSPTSRSTPGDCPMPSSARPLADTN